MKARPLNGVVVLDKPAGCTSAQAVATVKNTFSVHKAGHTGTLDPFATGVLVICLNQATRLARFFLHDRKRYRAVLHLGVATDTQDASGKVVASRRVPDFNRDAIGGMFARFMGRIQQVPPAYSALKHEGVPLYRLARKGRPVQKPPREIVVFELKVLAVSLPRVHFEVECSGGTYIRTLCADLGDAFGCGGHLGDLRRMASSGFSLQEALPLNRLKALAREERHFDRIIPMAEALRGMPRFVADAALQRKIRNGAVLSAGELPPPGRAGSEGGIPGYVKITDTANQLLAVVRPQGEGKRWSYCGVFTPQASEAEI